MQELLTQMIGHRVDVVCGGTANLRGEVVRVEGGVLYLKDDKNMSYVAIDKIAVVWEARDETEHRPGFVPNSLK